MNLEDNGLDSIEHLASADWPGLKVLILNRAGIHLSSIPQVLLQSSLETLHLSSNRVEAQAISDLISADLSCLKSLALRKTSTKENAIFRVASANWLHLQTLDLSQHSDSHRCINSTDLAALSGAHWPQLKCLRLGGIHLLVVGARHLVKGQWPQLERLDMSLSNIRTESMRVLVTGCWPLKRLLLMCSSVSSDAVSVLLQMGWASLDRLDMPTNHLSPTPWAVYSCVLDVASLKLGLNQLEPKNGRNAFQSGLLQLKELNFCDEWHLHDTCSLF